MGLCPEKPIVELKMFVYYIATSTKSLLSGVVQELFPHLIAGLIR